jgi:hypothetical protein
MALNFTGRLTKSSFWGKTLPIIWIKRIPPHEIVYNSYSIIEKKFTFIRLFAPNSALLVMENFKVITKNSVIQSLGHRNVDLSN